MSLMISPEETVLESLLLQEADFPDNFIDMHHPEDGIPQRRPLPCEMIYHDQYPERIRLILRISFKTPSGYIPISFICDTGAPNTLYFSPKFRNLLKPISKRDDMGNEYIQTYLQDNSRFRMKMTETPSIHQQANILGLRALMRFGLELHADGFSFSNLPEYL